MELVAEWFAGKTLVCGKTLFVSEVVCSREIKDSDSQKDGVNVKLQHRNYNKMP